MQGCATGRMPSFLPVTSSGRGALWPLGVGHHGTLNESASGSQLLRSSQELGLTRESSVAIGFNAWRQRGQCRDNMAETCPARLDGQFPNDRIMCAHVELLSLCAQIGDIGDTHITF